MDYCSIYIFSYQDTFNAIDLFICTVAKYFIYHLSTLNWQIYKTLPGLGEDESSVVRSRVEKTGISVVNKSDVMPMLVCSSVPILVMGCIDVGSMATVV